MKRRPKGLLEKSIEVSIPFHDIDVMEVAWHGNYVKYAENARHALLAAIDYDYPQMKESGYAWPVIEISFRYARPAVYGMSLKVSASLREFENRLWVDYEMTGPDGEIYCSGHSVQVAVEMPEGNMTFVSPKAFQDRVRSCLEASS
jgi:acyl-CoA thioester hydrolase